MCFHSGISPSSPDNSLDPSCPSNQNVDRGDGCFSSLFDCLIARVQDEMKASLETDDDKQNSSVKTSAVHSHLLAGLLGSDIDRFIEADEHVRNMERFVNSKYDFIDGDGDDVDDHFPLIAGVQREAAKAAILYGDKVVPETPTGLGAAAGDRSRTPSLDESFTYDHRITSPTNNSTSSEDFVFTTKQNNSSENDSDLKATSSFLSNASDPGHYGNRSKTVSLKASFSSFFTKLDDYGGSVEDVGSQEGISQLTLQTSSILSSVSTDNLPLNLLETRTPARAYSEDFTTTHEQSPFIKKVSTEKVTKRRSRRKRKLQSPARDTENTSADDSLLLKHFCEGTSQL